MSDLNLVAVCGRLTHDPELKYGASGTAYCNFSIANNTWNGREDKVNFFNCTVFAKKAESVSKYLHKGSQVIVEGKLDHSTWENNEGQKRHSVGILAHSVQFIGGKRETTENNEHQEPDNKYVTPPPEEERKKEEKPKEEEQEGTFESPVDDPDDIPF